MGSVAEIGITVQTPEEFTTIRRSTRSRVFPPLYTIAQVRECIFRRPRKRKEARRTFIEASRPRVARDRVAGLEATSSSRGVACGVEYKMLRWWVHKAF
jgi:hypothetical protein